MRIFISLLFLVSSCLYATTPERYIARRIPKASACERETTDFLAELQSCFEDLDFDVNVVLDDKGFTLLEIAIWRSSWEVVKALLLRGATVRGENPLHCAIRHSRFEFLRALAVFCPVFLREKNQTGETPLQMAEDSREWLAYEILKSVDTNLETLESAVTEPKKDPEGFMQESRDYEQGWEDSNSTSDNTEVSPFSPTSSRYLDIYLGQS